MPSGQPATPNTAQPGAPPQPQQQIQTSAAVPVVQGMEYMCGAPTPQPYGGICPAGYPHQLTEASAMPPEEAVQMVVDVPEGVAPGQPFGVYVNGQVLTLTCPPGVMPGQQVQVPATRISC